MQSTLLIFLASIFASVYSQAYLLPGYENRYSEFLERHFNQLKWQRNVGNNGQVFGTIGQTGDGLFGKAGYQQQIFNDNRGKLEGQAYGTRVLGQSGDSTNYGGRLDWSNKDAKAAVDINKPVGGQPTLTASGAGVWNIDKSTKVSAEGSVSTTGHGRPDVGVQAQIQHDF